MLGTLRNAVPEDALAVADVLVQAFPSLYCGTFGRCDDGEILWLLHSLYQADHLSLADTRVCEIGGRIAGVSILHTGQPIGRGSPAGFWSVLRQRFGLLRAPRMFFGGVMANRMLNRRIPRASDLVYIEALAVRESLRGCGIGTRLLDDAAHWARERGRTRLALHVLLNNTRARRLYERSGFRPWYDQGSHSQWQRSLPSAPWAALLMCRHIGGDSSG